MGGEGEALEENMPGSIRYCIGIIIYCIYYALSTMGRSITNAFIISFCPACYISCAASGSLAAPYSFFGDTIRNSSFLCTPQ